MWWNKNKIETTSKAVAYYRHSAQDRQEYSIPIQREQVHEFADDHRIKIIREFKDHGVSGLSSKGRDDFLEMLQYVAEGPEEFDYVLALDMSRWGRFQDLVLAPYYIGLCQQYGKKVIFTSIGFPQGDELAHFLRLNVESYRAATYSKELSDKVFKGCVNIAKHGFRAGGLPPYGLRRLLLDEHQKPVQVLKPGQRKSIQNQRVTLTPGDKDEIATVKKIFRSFVKKHQLQSDIAESLNNEGIPSPGHKSWTSSSVSSILQNELYVGTMVYNKTSQKLQSSTKHNPPDEWIRVDNAFDAIIDSGLFNQAQAMLAAQKQERLKKFSAEEMLSKLKRLYDKYGTVSTKQIAARRDMTSATTYSKHFMSLDMAFQNMFPKVLGETRNSVFESLSSKVKRVEQYEDYYVLNDTVSVLIQPSLPVPCGYGVYWSFWPDPRIEIDITLGVLLSNSKEHDILGYLVFPRMLVASRNMRVFSTSDGKLDLHGYCDLDMIVSILFSEEQR
jgi:DNA invertase Pin-like site-specific DNA recombinase